MTVVALAPSEHAPTGLEGLASSRLGRLAPGVVLSLLVATAGVMLEGVERQWLGRAYLESLVLAILVGAAVRTLCAPDARWHAGIAFSAKTLLEIAIVLLGASVSATTLGALGWKMLVGTALLVPAAIAASFAIGRMAGLPWRMATLIACGNSICGNSAIASVAPVIGAEGEDVAVAISFTALLGVATVIGLPILGSALHMAPAAYGAYSGLTVYAVPQVLAAAAPMGLLAVQTGAMVKLMRVLLLGPVCFALSLMTRQQAPGAPRAHRPKLWTLVPWFIVAFAGLALLRSAGLAPSFLLEPAAKASNVLTIVAMAALGLSTDLKAVVKAGPRAASVVTLSLVALGAISFCLIAIAF